MISAISTAHSHQTAQPVQLMTSLFLQSWEQTFQPINNHIDSNASLDGIMFETFGEELDFVLSNPARNIWTYIDDGSPVIISGFHLCNRLGYIVTKHSWADDISVTLDA